MTTTEFHPGDLVRTNKHPDSGLAPGNVGTVREITARGNVVVEFKGASVFVVKPAHLDRVDR